jgi:hypothetical protein
VGWEGGPTGRDGGGEPTNVQYKPIWNCHSESPLYSKHILIKIHGKNTIDKLDVKGISYKTITTEFTLFANESETFTKIGPKLDQKASLNKFQRLDGSWKTLIKLIKLHSEKTH